MQNIFADFIGQEGPKNKLKFYLEAQKKGGIIPPMLFIGAKGQGKTAFARKFMKNLGNSRKNVEINGSTLKNISQFMSQVYFPLILDKEANVLFDECHCLGNSVIMAFLSIFNTETNHITEFEYDGIKCPFDFSRQTYIFATTESHAVFPPLKDRLTKVEFNDYSVSELGQMLKNQLLTKEIDVESEALKMLAETLRGNARNAILRAKDVILYCQQKNKNKIKMEEVKEICRIFDVFPLGLTKTEMTILRGLRNRGEMSLQDLANMTGLPRAAIQRDYESHLGRLGLMRIDGKRKITSMGCKIVEDSEK